MEQMTGRPASAMQRHLPPAQAARGHHLPARCVVATDSGPGVAAVVLTGEAARRQQRRHLIITSVVWILSVGVAMAAVAQAPKKPQTQTPQAQTPQAQTPQAKEPPANASPAKTPQAKSSSRAAKGAAGEKEAKMEPVTLQTKDNVQLRAFYFPSDKGKDAVPVMIVHEWQGQASPYARLALALQEAGFAVLIPEYRGHGGSREYTNRRGQTQTFNVANMTRNDVEAIIMRDLESAKGFLKEKNNAGELNLNALVVIGVREGGIFATNWASRDWRFPSIGRIKQGQDVKALVLVSPEDTINGVGIDPVLRDPNILRLPIMIVAGAGSEEASTAQQIGKRIEAMKRRAGRGETTGFQLDLPSTNLSGQALVNDLKPIIPSIISFIRANVPVGANQNPWIERQ